MSDYLRKEIKKDNKRWLVLLGVAGVLGVVIGLALVFGDGNASI